jgi:hypothetical protein
MGPGGLQWIGTIAHGLAHGAEEHVLHLLQVRHGLLDLGFTHTRAIVHQLLKGTAIGLHDLQQGRVHAGDSLGQQGLHLVGAQWVLAGALGRRLADLLDGCLDVFQGQLAPLQRLERGFLNGLAQGLALSRRGLGELPHKGFLVKTELGHGVSPGWLVDGRHTINLHQETM